MMARLDSLIAVLLLLTTARVRSLDLEDYSDVDDNSELPAPYYSDFSPPKRSPEAVLASELWSGNRDDLVDRGEGEEEISAPQKRPLVKRRTLRIKARAATADDLHQLFGEPTRRKKSVKSQKSTLFRRYLQSALQQRHASVKKKRSAERQRVVKRSGLRKKRPFDKDEEEAEAKTSDVESGKIQRLQLINALLSQENGFLTEALNQATVAQTNGNDEANVREEIEQIQNAEKIEAIMRQLARDDQAMKEAEKKNEDPEDVEETVVVTRTSISDLASCPVVKKLATGCSRVASKFDFEMDKDASDACDEHRICYSCSFAFSASRDICDRLFIEQSRRLCEKEDDRRQCKAEGAELLEAMQQTHREEYEASSQLEDTCHNPCVKDYFRAVYRSRR